tara:strand:- start:37 stop:567 length:531 start_codon:yes stop_codon:yes gene_type:complete
MSIIKAQNGLKAIEENELTSDYASTLKHMLENYVRTGNKGMWKGAKMWAKATGYDKYLGYLPYSVQKRLTEINAMVSEEYMHFYKQMYAKHGYIFANVSNRWLKDLDDADDKENIQALALAKSRGNSVERYLKKQYQMGEWDGTIADISDQYQKHNEILMEGYYGYEQYAINERDF